MTNATESSTAAIGNIDDSDDHIPSFVANVRRPLELLAHCPAYQATPLHTVDHLQAGTLFVKDERSRMGLGSFKALGGVYAVAVLIADHWKNKTDLELLAIDYDRPDVRAFADALTFVCASAGNHGLAVAAGANIFGAHARIYLADTVPEAFAERLTSKGAEVVRGGTTYEDSVEAAIEDARNTESILLADSSWNDYWRPPSLVMEGYTVLADELKRDLKSRGEWPTHLFLQAGVGGLAAAVTYMIRNDWHYQPQITIVEPTAARCLEESAEAGHPVEVNGPISNMGRLDCKVPSLIAHRLLSESDVSYQAVSDNEADDACQSLRDFGFPSTPSGAAGFAGLNKVLEQTKVDSDFRPLIIVTEGPLR